MTDASLRPLGRRPPTDDRHLRKYSLTAETMPDLPTPVVLGLNWYRAFDYPRRDGSGAWSIQADNWGPVRGGHAICVRPPSLVDTTGWWRFYDQQSEGACVGYSISRMMTLLNRTRYDAARLYHEALKVDEWPGEADEGTSVRAGCDVAREQGVWRVRAGKILGPYVGDGISENRWARSVEEIAACLEPASGGMRVLNAGYVHLLNSWGTNYPHYTRLDLESLDRLIFHEDGEATVVIDRA